jgi:hypothetical protein
MRNSPPPSPARCCRKKSGPGDCRRCMHQTNTQSQGSTKTTAIAAEVDKVQPVHLGAPRAGAEPLLEIIPEDQSRSPTFREIKNARQLDAVLRRLEAEQHIRFFLVEEGFQFRGIAKARHAQPTRIERLGRYEAAHGDAHALLALKPIAERIDLPRLGVSRYQKKSLSIVFRKNHRQHQMRHGEICRSQRAIKNRKPRKQEDARDFLVLRGNKEKHHHRSDKESLAPRKIHPLPENPREFHRILGRLVGRAHPERQDCHKHIQAVAGKTSHQLEVDDALKDRIPSVKTSRQSNGLKNRMDGGRAALAFMNHGGVMVIPGKNKTSLPAHDSADPRRAQAPICSRHRDFTIDDGPCPKPCRRQEV